MGVGGKTLDLIRNIFRQSDVDRPPYVPPIGYQGLQTQQSFFGVGSPTHIFGMADYLKTEQELVSRFVDYEDMDDNPLVASCHDIFSEDATQVDHEQGKTVWARSNDGDVQRELDDLFQKRLRIEERVWADVRTLVKYGNLYAEIVAKDQQGVVALNNLPPPTVRRIEIPREIGTFAWNRIDIDADTLGFIYDPRGLFKITTEEFIKEMNARAAGQQVEKPAHEQHGNVVFESWEVMHCRLIGKTPTSIYGFGVGEPARWIFKRLLLLEDSVLYHRLCLRGDTNVWTTSGYKKIKDLNEGDEVYTFGKDLKLKKTKVIYKKCNGRDKIYRVASKHREIFANSTHPVLTEIEVHQGSGKPILRGMEYVEVKNLIPGVHKFVTPEIPEQMDPVRLRIPCPPKKARLKATHALAVRPFGLAYVGQEQGVEYGRLRKFVRGERWLPDDTAKRVCAAIGIDLDGLEIVEDWGNLRQVNIPEIVTEDFARLWGFMLGDGFLGQKRHKNGYLARNNVGIALGDDLEMNARYIDLFRRFFGQGYLSKKGDRDNSYSINSKLVFEFFEINGYIPGAENKRIPEWVFRLGKKERLAFINGLVDADGYRKESRSEGIRDRELSGSVVIETCNKLLMEDLRELCMQTGLSVGKSVTSRGRKGGHLIEGREMPDTTSYKLHFSFLGYEQEREIDTIEEVGEDEIWDIGVEADEHNFVANGVVVHNTRAPSRYAFYIDVSQMPPQEVQGYLNKVKQALKKQKFVNSATGGKTDQRFDVLSTMDDFFLPVRDGKESTRVESLSGPVYDHIEDIRYFEDKLFAAFKVPRPFLTYEQTTAKTHLSAEDARFARSVMRIQREYIQGLRKVAKVHLAARGINPETVEFEIKMTIPSAIFELAQLEIRAAELDLAEKFGAWAPKPWIMQNVLHFTHEEIAEMGRLEQIEKEAGTEKPSGSASGSIDRLASRRGTPAVSSAESFSAKDGRVLLERLDEMRRRNAQYDRKWSQLTTFTREIRDRIRPVSR